MDAKRVDYGHTTIYQSDSGAIFHRNQYHDLDSNWSISNKTSVEETVVYSKHSSTMVESATSSSSSSPLSSEGNLLPPRIRKPFNGVNNV